MVMGYQVKVDFPFFFLLLHTQPMILINKLINKFPLFYLKKNYRDLDILVWVSFSFNALDKTQLSLFHVLEVTQSHKLTI